MLNRLLFRIFINVGLFKQKIKDLSEDIESFESDRKIKLILDNDSSEIIHREDNNRVEISFVTEEKLSHRIESDIVLILKPEDTVYR